MVHERRRPNDRESLLDLPIQWEKKDKEWYNSYFYGDILLQLCKPKAHWNEYTSHKEEAQETEENTYNNRLKENHNKLSAEDGNAAGTDNFWVYIVNTENQEIRHQEYGIPPHYYKQVNQRIYTKEKTNTHKCNTNSANACTKPLY